jgi:hypothetical protein
MILACEESPTPPDAEPALASSPARRRSITPVLDTRGARGARRRRVATQSIGVPVYSRIVYRSGSVSVR